MNELTISTKNDSLLSGPGIPFCVEYPELDSSLYVTLHLEGTMTYRLPDGSLRGGADPSVLSSEVCSALAIAISKMTEQIGHPSKIPDHSQELSALLRDRLSARWKELYGAEPDTLTIADVSMSEDDQASIEKMDDYAAFSRKSPEEQTNAMVEKLRAAQTDALNRLRPQTESWTCTCGTVNTGNYCTECGQKRVWVCECGAVNTGNFCPDCGKPRGPSAARSPER